MACGSAKWMEALSIIAACAGFQSPEMRQPLHGNGWVLWCLMRRRAGAPALQRFLLPRMPPSTPRRISLPSELPMVRMVALATLAAGLAAGFAAGFAAALATVLAAALAAGLAAVFTAFFAAGLPPAGVLRAGAVAATQSA